MRLVSRLGLLTLLLAFVACAAPTAPVAGAPPAWLLVDEDEGDEEEVVEEVVEDEGHGIGHHLLFYIPNRIFDVFDIVRARVRVGPGFGLSLRATELADLNLAAYTSAWIGIHGPRRDARIPWPVGLETLATAELSVVGAEAAPADAWTPTYGIAEIGVGVHVALVGVDVGVDPLEILDLVTGLVFIDLVGDDY